MTLLERELPRCVCPNLSIWILELAAELKSKPYAAHRFDDERHEPISAITPQS